MNPSCAAFMENVAVSAMMGAGLALGNVPEDKRKDFIDQWSRDVTALAVALHNRLHAHTHPSATPPPRPPTPPTPPFEDVAATPRKMPLARDGFLTFDEVLLELNIDENRLKRLVSEGELRAFREGGDFRFKKSEIQAIKGGLR